MRSTTPVGAMLCIQSDMTTREYARACAFIGQKPSMHRKQWEFVAIIRALQERNLLDSGRYGIGFGCGCEPLPAAFGRAGVRVLATDIDANNPLASAWIATAQHLSRGQHRELFTYRDCDMNHIPPDMQKGEADFVWSSCAMEHLGSLELGLRFVRESVRALKPGGWALHTTEFNLGSDDRTLSDGVTVLFRRRDLARLRASLAGLGTMGLFDLTTGSGAADLHIDAPPYGLPHLKLQIEEFRSTSVLLLVQRT